MECNGEVILLPHPRSANLFILPPSSFILSHPLVPATRLYTAICSIYLSCFHPINCLRKIVAGLLNAQASKGLPRWLILQIPPLDRVSSCRLFGTDLRFARRFRDR
jgi:hypothetical protein